MRCRCLKDLTFFKKMLTGGIIRNDEMGEAWEVVFRTQRLSPVLNASTTIDKMRERLSEIIGTKIDTSTIVFVPFYTNFGKHIELGKNVFINHACTFLDLGGIAIQNDVQIGPKVNLITENHPVDPAKRKYLDLRSILIKRMPG
ncbi:sugar O-acetyltransferase [Chryseosolibacter histidini]|uniref:sugar O-acetyltransferase n=1 Tax=Chryseosolibacter histidini TaxID=2782349 RepID=UPI00293D26FB|nr:sugar O-acetyltransferase [Chryseosolibacter histidini]